MAGCKGAKEVLAINTDPEAAIMANADYAVIGDLAEIVPAITAEIQRVRERPSVAGAIALALRRRRPRGAGLFARRARLLVRLVRMGEPRASTAPTTCPTRAARARRSSCSASASSCSGRPG